MDQSYRLEIIDRDGWRNEFPLGKTVLHIGSSDRNDIVLEPTRGGEVAPLHAQLIIPGPQGRAGSHGSCPQLVNLGDVDILLGSSGDQRLPPRSVLSLEDGSTFRLGQFTLVFHGDRSSAGESLGGSRHIGLSLSMPRTQLEPNRFLDGVIRVANLGDRSGVQIELDLEGLDPDCYNLEPGPILSAGAEKEVFFRLRHYGHRPPAGEYYVTIRATAAHAYPGDEAIVSQSVEVLPFYRHKMQLVSPNGMHPSQQPPRDEAVASEAKPESRSRHPLPHRGEEAPEMRGASLNEDWWSPGIDKNDPSESTATSVATSPHEAVEGQEAGDGELAAEEVSGRPVPGDEEHAANQENVQSRPPSLEKASVSVGEVIENKGCWASLLGLLSVSHAQSRRPLAETSSVEYSTPTIEEGESSPETLADSPTAVEKITQSQFDQQSSRDFQSREEADQSRPGTSVSSSRDFQSREEAETGSEPAVEHWDSPAEAGPTAQIGQEVETEAVLPESEREPEVTAEAPGACEAEMQTEIATSEPTQDQAMPEDMSPLPEEQEEDEAEILVPSLLEEAPRTETVGEEQTKGEDGPEAVTEHQEPIQDEEEAPVPVVAFDNGKPEAVEKADVGADLNVEDWWQPPRKEEGLKKSPIKLKAKPSPAGGTTSGRDASKSTAIDNWWTAPVEADEPDGETRILKLKATPLPERETADHKDTRSGPGEDWWTQETQAEPDRLEKQSVLRLKAEASAEADDSEQADAGQETINE
jgi:hypothetical protein